MTLWRLSAVQELMGELANYKEAVGNNPAAPFVDHDGLAACVQTIPEAVLKNYAEALAAVESFKNKTKATNKDAKSLVKHLLDMCDQVSEFYTSQNGQGVSAITKWNQNSAGSKL